MNTLATSLLFGCIGITLAWLARRPVRHVVGVGPAFCLWLLPPLLALVAWLPAWHVGGGHSDAFPALPILVTTAPVFKPAGSASMDLAHWLLLLWLTGVGLMLARLAVHCLGIMHRSRPLPAALRASLREELAGLDPHTVRLHPAGPAVCWLPHCRLLLPADLLERFDHAQRTHVLAHERMHLARRDPLWSLLAELMLAALWFFPLTWWALDRFHLDQELACDAAILDRSPRQAGAYARALLSGTATRRAVGPTTAWLSRSQLKERLTMIHQHARTPLKRRTGYALLAALLGGATLVAQAAMPVNPASTLPDRTDPHIAYAAPLVRQSTAQTASADSAIVNPAYLSRQPPRYPPEAKKKHEQGTVTLLVLVGTDGKPLQVKVDRADTHAAQSLVAAATQAAVKWRFKPMQRNGKAGKFWARVPVTFELPSVHSATSTAVPHVNMASQEQHPPTYPPAAIKHHKQGTVVLLVLVDTQGQPVDVKVERGVTPALDKAAVDAAEHWRFTPAVRDGKPYKAWARVPVKFSLSEPDMTHPEPPKGSGMR